jgi:hypothetical protein
MTTPKNPVLRHILKQRFIYLVLPATLMAIYFVILLTNRLTGRESTDDIGAIVGYFYAVIPCVLAAALTVMVKTHIDITRESKIDGTAEITSPWELFISRGSTIALIWLFLHFIAGK